MVAHRKGTARNQFSFICLEDLIAEDNLVRVIDAFVDIIDFKQLGFSHIEPKKTGNPPYHPGLLLRIYLYGYLNRVRSSRKLATECKRNIEMQWLCETQTPCYHTIATFRTYKNDDTKINHPKALKEVFRTFNRFLNGEELFGKETVATDGTKMRAQNAKKKNYTEDKLEKKIELSDANIVKYLEELEQYDKQEALSEEQSQLQKDAKEKLEQIKKWNIKYKDLKQELRKRQEIDPSVTQISQTDPDARSIVINNSGHAEVAFNIVTAVDEKNKLIANYFTENVHDSALLGESLIAVKAEFDTNFDENLHNITHNTEGVDVAQKLNKNTYLNGLADKGFHAASQLQECADNNILKTTDFF
jgi:transposase